AQAGGPDGSKAEAALAAIAAALGPGQPQKAWPARARARGKRAARPDDRAGDGGRGRPAVRLAAAWRGPGISRLRRHSRPRRPRSPGFGGAMAGCRDIL